MIRRKYVKSDGEYLSKVIKIDKQSFYLETNHIISPRLTFGEDGFTWGCFLSQEEIFLLEKEYGKPSGLQNLRLGPVFSSTSHC